MVVGAGNDAAVFPTQVGTEHLLRGASGSRGDVDAEAMEHLDGPRSHSAGDDHVGVQIANEPRHHAGLVHLVVWIGYDP